MSDMRTVSTAIRQAEVTAIDRTQERFGICLQRLAADTGYGDAAQNLRKLAMPVRIEEQEISR
nr:hypothetical protein [Sphingobium sp. EM0848]